MDVSRIITVGGSHVVVEAAKHRIRVICMNEPRYNFGIVRLEDSIKTWFDRPNKLTICYLRRA